MKKFPDKYVLAGVTDKHKLPIIASCYLDQYVSHILYDIFGIHHSYMYENISPIPLSHQPAEAKNKYTSL